jgi:hypothetical protein
MSQRLFVAAFADEDHLLAAVRHARASGQDVVEVFAPYPVHGLPEALALAPSRLPWACLAFGLVGLAIGLTLEVWTSAVDWPLNVGGKPLLSWPAFVPVAFELVVLFAGLGTVATFLVRERGRRRPPKTPATLRATDDRFVVTIAATDATFDAEALSRVYRERFGADEVEEVLAEGDAS